MAARAPQTDLTPEEYIALERKAIPDADTVSNEYVKGETIARSGASRAHNLVSGILTEHKTTGMTSWNT